MSVDPTVVGAGIGDGFTKELGGIAEPTQQVSGSTDFDSGGVLTLVIHLSGDLQENMKKIDDRPNDSERIETPWGTGVVVDGRLYRDESARRSFEVNTLCHQVIRAANDGSLFDQQNATDQRAERVTNKGER